jgi:hypothetical protein
MTHHPHAEHGPHDGHHPGHHPQRLHDVHQLTCQKPRLQENAKDVLLPSMSATTGAAEASMEGLVKYMNTELHDS